MDTRNWISVWVSPVDGRAYALGPSSSAFFQVQYQTGGVGWKQSILAHTSTDNGVPAYKQWLIPLHQNVHLNFPFYYAQLKFLSFLKQPLMWKIV